ncbi:retrovirus-related pol polyprotein from transposon TNT 1-94 [Tanacetum coccineum]|uniref:Retrovirus-related pol polyprotein from transposon TNT 1-94 n=1 Tax=Tanacetum coccineum TaxID=301880 RepID=A0ABQ4XG62_9ASTR
MDAEQAFWLRISNPTSKPSDASLVKIEAPKELPKVSLVNESLKKLKFHLARFDNMVKIRTTPDARTEGEWGFEHTKAVFNNKIIPFLKSLKDIFNLFDRDLLNEIMENDLKAQLQDKDTTICKLKDMIKSMREKSKEENAKYDYGKIETKNVELENSVAKLISKNERLCNEINHVKQGFKEQFDSIKKTCVHTKEHSDSLIDKMNLKSAENEDLKAQIQDKLDLEPLAPRLLQNMEIHIEYLKYSQEQADILRGLVEQAKAKQPLDKELDFACKHAQRIQELLVYVRDTCPNAINLSAKKVAVTPKNKVKKVRFAEPLTSSSNIKQVESLKTLDSNTPMLSSTGLKCSTSKCGSKPTSNKKNDRISRPSSRNMKIKVEAQPRKVNKKNSVVEPICDVDVKHSLLNANSKPICAHCKKSMFDGVHDKYLLDFVKNVNSRAKSAKKHKKQNIWKHTGHVFTEVGLYGNQQAELSLVVQIVLWYLDSDCLKHTTGNRLQLMNFVSKFLVEGLGHNLFSVGQFCDADLEVAIQKNTCFIHNLEGVDLLSGSRDTNLYTVSLDDMLKTSSICLLSKASKTKSWLWHRRLSHLNFGTINKLAKDSLARGIPRLKFKKDHLCYACELGKMIVDDYSRFTWVRFLRTKDEAPEAIIKCIKNIQVRLNATVRNVQTDNGTKFVNQTLHEFYENVGISHQTSVARTLQQNSDKKLNLSFFHVFGALFYPTNDNDDLGKLDAKVDIGIFVGYAPAKKAFRIYNKRTQKIIETILVTFDELTAMASEQFSS